MKFKKYLALIVSCSIAAILIVLELVMLFRFSGHYSDVRSKLRSSESEVKSLMKRDPFPSEENVVVERNNLEKLNNQLIAERKWMRDNQIQYEEWTTPTEFQIKLDPNLQVLRSKARERKIVLPPDFSFSFGKYAQGEMPAAANVPRLSRQLQMIKTLCEILFANKIDMLQSVSRTEFDAGGGTESGQTEPLSGSRTFGRGVRDVPAPKSKRDESLDESVGEHGMFAWEDIEVDFSAREQALWNILRELTNTNLLVSIEDLKFNSSTESIERLKTPEGRESSLTARRAMAFNPEDADRALRARDLGEETIPLVAKEQKQIPSREERVISGDESVAVNMKVRMYRFLREQGQEESGQ